MHQPIITTIVRNWFVDCDTMACRTHHKGGGFFQHHRQIERAIAARLALTSYFGCGTPLPVTNTRLRLENFSVFNVSLGSYKPVSSCVTAGVAVVVVALCFVTFQCFVVMATASVGTSPAPVSPEVGSCATPLHTRRQLSIVKNLLALPLQPPYVNRRQSAMATS